MRPSEFVAIRPHVQGAIDDIDYFLNGANELVQAKREMRARYDLLEAGWTPPKAKGRRNRQLTKTQFNALVHGVSVYGNPLTDEKREAALAKLGPGEPVSDSERKALAFWARGGWPESSRQVAVWLQKAGETVAADGIDIALRRLPEEPGEAAKLIWAILMTFLDEQAPAANTKVEVVIGEPAEPLAEPTDAQGAVKPRRRGRKKANYETVQIEASLAADWGRARDAGTYKIDFAKDNKMTVKILDALLDRVAKRKRATE